MNISGQIPLTSFFSVASNKQRKGNAKEDRRPRTLDSKRKRGLAQDVAEEPPAKKWRQHNNVLQSSASSNVQTLLPQKQLDTKKRPGHTQLRTPQSIPGRVRHKPASLGSARGGGGSPSTQGRKDENDVLDFCVLDSDFDIPGSSIPTSFSLKTPQRSSRECSSGTRKDHPDTHHVFPTPPPTYHAKQQRAASKVVPWPQQLTSPIRETEAGRALKPEDSYFPSPGMETPGDRLPGRYRARRLGSSETPSTQGLDYSSPVGKPNTVTHQSCRDGSSCPSDDPFARRTLPRPASFQTLRFHSDPTAHLDSPQGWIPPVKISTKTLPHTESDPLSFSAFTSETIILESPGDEIVPSSQSQYPLFCKQSPTQLRSSKTLPMDDHNLPGSESQSLALVPSSQSQSEVEMTWSATISQLSPRGIGYRLCPTPSSKKRTRMPTNCNDMDHLTDDLTLLKDFASFSDHFGGDPPPQDISQSEETNSYEADVEDTSPRGETAGNEAECSPPIERPVSSYPLHHTLTRTNRRDTTDAGIESSDTEESEVEGNMGSSYADMGSDESLPSVVKEFWDMFEGEGSYPDDFPMSLR